MRSKNSIFIFSGFRLYDFFNEMTVTISHQQRKLFIKSKIQTLSGNINSNFHSSTFSKDTDLLKLENLKNIGDRDDTPENIRAKCSQITRSTKILTRWNIGGPRADQVLATSNYWDSFYSHKKNSVVSTK